MTNRPAESAGAKKDGAAEADAEDAPVPAQDAPTITELSDEAETPEELQALWEAEGPAPAGGISNLVACLFTGVFGLVGIVLSMQLGLGSLTAPGPGFFPFVVAIIAAVLSLAQVILGRRGGDGEKFTRYSATVIWGIISLILFVALLPVIGFEIPALLLSFVWMKFLGGERWRSATIYSVLVVVAFYLIFVVALRTQIPHLF